MKCSLIGTLVYIYGVGFMLSIAFTVYCFLKERIIAYPALVFALIFGLAIYVLKLL